MFNILIGILLLFKTFMIVLNFLSNHIQWKHLYFISKN